MKLYKKLKDIRVKFLKMNQSDLALAVGSFQKDIPLLENGNKEFIPNEYLEYFVKEGIDLNSLFHPDEKICKRKECSSQKEM